jgi:hypothetical protein
LVLAAGAVLVAGMVPAHAASETPVITTSNDDYQPTASSSGYFAWTANSSGMPNHYDTIVRPPTGPDFFANELGTSGFGSGLDGTRLVYQQIEADKIHSDIKQIDVSTLTRTDAPTGVNTDVWEWHPSTSGDLYFFSRNNIGFVRHPNQKIMLVNGGTSAVETLDKVKGKSPYLVSGQVSGQYAVWTKCVTGSCAIYRWDDTAQHKTKLSDQGAPWGPSVTPDGTTYYFRNNPRKCGDNVKVFRRDPGGTTSLIANLPHGRFGLNSTATVNDDASVDLYFDQFPCSGGAGDIYKIVGADTATPLVERVSSASSAGAGSTVGPQAGPMQEPPQPVGWTAGSLPG